MTMKYVFFYYYSYNIIIKNNLICNCHAGCFVCNTIFNFKNRTRKKVREKSNYFKKLKIIENRKEINR